MSEMTPETPGPSGTEELGGQETTDANGGHPAWQAILDVLPDEALRTLVTPKLQEWDNGVNQRFQQLHETYEPWKPIIEAANPEVVQQSLGLLQQIEQDPEYVVKALIEAYGLDLSQGQPGTQPQEVAPQTVNIDGQEFDANDPLVQRLTAMEEVLGGLNEFIQNQTAEQQEADAIAAYDAYMGQLREKHPGPYDETVIDAMVANGVDPEQALLNYQNAVKQAALGQPPVVDPNRTAPVVMGGTAGGSGLPTERVNPADLNSQDTRALVAEMVRKMQEGN